MARRLVLVVALVIAGLAVVQFADPFGTEERDRSQPVLLRSIEDLGELRTARANLQVVVDLEQDSALPDFLKGSRTLFVAAGTVDAAVDLRRARVRTSGDTAVITVPPPVITPPRLDLARSRVYDRDRGVLDRIGDALSDDGTNDQRVYELAQRKLAEAANADGALEATARRNAEQILGGLARGLGFARVTVRFEQPRV